MNNEKYGQCIMCGLHKVQIIDIENATVSNFEAICEDCYAEYQEELAEKAEATHNINTTTGELPF